MITATRINRLAQVVADAIAAGEVVERPASVVKELVENALDAGAHRIDVSLHGGGLIDIEVCDDGAGIAAADLDLAVARHATSKIARAEDLSRVRTLGFRGEALASIAAVSDLTLVSRDGASAAATSLRVRHGDTVERALAAAPRGTRVRVCELFAGTPARLRFLHSAGAESAAVLRLVTELALLNPEVACTCHSDDREQLRTPGGSLRHALRAVYGARAAGLISLDGTDLLRVGGAISAPDAHRGNRGGLVLGVNRRRVHHRGLQVAVEEAYRGLIPSGRYPYGVVLVEMDPAEVDVNVHPAKREVRFRDERRVFTAVQRACWAALQGGPAAGAARLVLAGYLSSADAGAVTLADGSAGAPGGAETLAARAAAAAGTQRNAIGAGKEATGVEAPGAGARSLAELAPMVALGQSGGEWLVARARGALVIVDPHAAHEKSIYQELLHRWAAPGGRPLDMQLLLIPALVPADLGRLERLERHRDFIASCGFAIDVFGPDLLRCTAIPAGAGAADAARLVADFLDALGGDGVPVDARRARIAAVVACHSAVRFGDRLGPDAQQRLLDRLVQTPGGMTCPHGRPTAIVLDDASLRRAFRRPQR